MKLSLLLSFAVVAAAASCSTSTPDAATNARNAGINAAGTAALKDAGRVLTTAGAQALLSIAQQELSGGNVDYGHAAAAGLWSQVTPGAGVSVLGDIVRSYSAGKAAETAREADRLASNAIRAGQSPVSVANAIAATISTAAGAPPAK